MTLFEPSRELVGLSKGFRYVINVKNIGSSTLKIMMIDYIFLLLIDNNVDNFDLEHGEIF